MSATTMTVSEASKHLYEALTHHAGNRDFDAHDPLVMAISQYGEACRSGDDAAASAAGEHVSVELTRHFGPRDLDAHDPFVLALAEYAAACKAAGPRH